MKRNVFFYAALAVLLCMLLLCGCGQKQTEEEQQTPSSPELSNPTTPIDGPVYSGSNIADSPFVGRFENSYSAQFASNAEDVYVIITENEDGTVSMSPLDLPLLECRADGTFSLTVMTTVGGDYATLNGTFTVDGEYAEFTVAAGNYGDFLGADTEKFTCHLLNEDDIKYWGDQVGTVVGGDIFRRKA